MRIKTLLTITLSLILGLTYAQNEKTNREEFILKLPVDGEQFYEQKVENSPYFVKENVLQIYPSEKLFIEVELTKKEVEEFILLKDIDATIIDPNIMLDSHVPDGDPDKSLILKYLY